MNERNLEIGQRLREARNLSGQDMEAFAREVGIGAEELRAYEAGERDVPVSVMHNIAALHGVTTTELMTGEPARLRQYCVVRKDKGVAVERREAYGYRSLAYNFAGREMEPMFITIPPCAEDEAFSLNTHKGQEFHFCLEGSFTIQVGDHRITMGEGDSIYFDSAYPHGMKALGGAAAKSLVIITM
ncbi:MAG: cupin domain-containing protein [Oscillospiraceae bacterium]|jgi:mannose-6-phosphate isomerase-like protein (cupin superfamily)|nr:cupin domain-containing protein [Oscillospiraceae bacterium]